MNDKRTRRGDLFMRGLLTLVLTVLFLAVAAGIIALMVWGALEFGALMLPATMLVGVVIALAWAVAGWLLK